MDCNLEKIIYANQNDKKGSLEKALAHGINYLKYIHNGHDLSTYRSESYAFQRQIESLRGGPVKQAQPHNKTRKRSHRSRST